MAEKIPQSTVFRVPLKAYLSSDHVTPATGKTIAITISKNGVAYGNPSGGATNAVEVGNGSYYVDLSTTDTNTLGPLYILGTATGVDPAETIYTVVKATNWGITAIPDTAVSTNASLLTSGTGTDQVSVSGGKVLLQASQPGVTIPTVTALTNSVTVGTNNDKTGYSLTVTPPTASQIATAIWADTNASDFLTPGTPGGILVGQLGGVFTTTTSSIFSAASLALSPDALSRAVPGSYSPGTAGYAIGNYLTAALTPTRSGTAQGGGSSTITFDAGASSITPIYKGSGVRIISGTGAGQSRTITSYNGGTKVATVDFPWAVNPDNTSGFIIIPTLDPARNTLLQVATSNSQATINTGIVAAATATTVKFNGSASTTDGLYVGNTVAIVGGTGVGQSRYIVSYNGSTRTATIDRPWITSPVAGVSTYSVLASTNANFFSDQGTAQGGGSATITLAPTASSVDDTYNGSLVTLLSGTGAGQTGEISSYVGSTRVATVSLPWSVVPDATTAYAVIPSQSHSDSTSTLTPADVTQAVWGSLLGTYSPGQAGYILASIVSGVILASNAMDGVVAESGVDVRQAVGLILDLLLAKLSGNGGTAPLTLTFRDINDTIDRASIVIDGSGNRTSSTVLNLP